MFDIAAPEIKEVVTGPTKNSTNLPKMWEQKQLRNNWAVEKRNPSLELVKPDPFFEKSIEKQSLSQSFFLTKENECKPK